MKEKTEGKPIMFSHSMVRAMVEDRKTKTRRKVKGVLDIKGCTVYPSEPHKPTYSLSLLMDNCPFGRPGDLLYVREDFRVSSFYDQMSPSQVPALDTVKIHYDADGWPPSHAYGFGKKRENMYMPRWMSRITLELVNVRVERLQEISLPDCWAEGITQNQVDIAERYLLDHLFLEDTVLRGGNPTCWAYAKLWEDLHGPGTWQENPFVWVLEFRVLQGNIDTILQERISAHV